MMAGYKNILWLAKTLLKLGLYLMLFFASQYVAAMIFMVLRIDYFVYEGAMMGVYTIIALVVLFIILRIEDMGMFIENDAYYRNAVKQSEIDIEMAEISHERSVAQSGFPKRDEAWCSGETLKHSHLDRIKVMQIVIAALGILGIVELYFVLFEYLGELFQSKSIEQAMETYDQSVDRYTFVEQTVVPYWDHLINYLTLILLVPIVEEIMFRGLLFGILKRRLPFGAATFLSSLAFGIGHGNAMQIGYALIAGMILCTLYYYTKSIYASIIAHGVFNLVGGVLTVIPKDFPSVERVFVAISNAFTVAAFLSIPITIGILVILVREGKKQLSGTTGEI